ncbi:MAG: hypothetical protein JO165_02630 [Candidatus Eremiobacteraeota bacterium]|nr:hypothetical protein [Candidatus Eremiobacteraeota bacterium]
MVDDIQADAGTEYSREDDEEWFRGIVSTRLEPNGIVVMISTRWAEDDLVGRIREGASGKQWTFVNVPAFAEENDPLKRKPAKYSGRNVGRNDCSKNAKPRLAQFNSVASTRAAPCPRKDAS